MRSDLYIDAGRRSGWCQVKIEGREAGLREDKGRVPGRERETRGMEGGQR